MGRVWIPGACWTGKINRKLEGGVPLRARRFLRGDAGLKKEALAQHQQSHPGDAQQAGTQEA